ncbi:MAG: ThuA domain-containing protein [Anaerolineae bacterium]|nr:ThuA domain-containing protein [Anaerolineae bacterium]
MTKALIVWGGWDGHEPEGISKLLGGALEEQGVEVTISDTLDAFKDLDLTQFDLLVPVWTMGTITKDQLKPVLEAVKEHGVGIGGLHGGMCDSFRNETEWQLMTGGQWVAHPGNDGIDYTVEVNPAEPNPITAGVPWPLHIKSEQYYMHVDPAIKVLATTTFSDGTVMPVVWTKMYGKGRVFYCSLGHHVDVVEPPTILDMVIRGLLWAACAEKVGQPA